MARPVLMPKPGQMTEECVVTTWFKQVGDAVHRGDALFEIETDKASMEVEAFDEGVLLARVVMEGEAAPVNTIVAWIGAAGEEVPPTPATPPIAGDGAASSVAAAAPSRQDAAASATPRAPVAAPATDAHRLRISPRASRLAADAGLDPRAITGSGPEGRIVERDVRAAIDARGAIPAEPAAAQASPAQARPAPASRPAAPPTAVHPLPAQVVDGEEPPRPLSRMRRVIAERLAASWQSTPHFTVTVAVDVTGVLALRAELRTAGTSLTVTDFVLATTAQTLVEFPDVNSRTDGTLLYPRRRVHLGIAVAVPGGLVVPVIRDADRLSIAEVHDRAADLAAAARDGSLSLDDMSGSTFTVSNLGMIGVDEFSAIINPGEAAILAVASAVPTAVVEGDAIVIRSIMKLTLSADHRLVDGETGARFLNVVRRRLEDVGSMRAEVLRG